MRGVGVGSSWGEGSRKSDIAKTYLPCNPLSADNQHFTKTFFKGYTLNCLIISNLKILWYPCGTLQKTRVPRLNRNGINGYRRLCNPCSKII
jgi:hypothetical protein